MDNTLGYIIILPFDIKLIIYSKLSNNLIKNSDLSGRYSEIIFSYRYPKIYRKFKNIIKVNKSLEFDNYTTEGPYFWHMLLKDELSHERRSYGHHHHDGKVFYTWEGNTEYMNTVSITMHCLIDFYDIYPMFYKYLNTFMEYPIGIMLLNDSLEYALSDSDGTLNQFLSTGIAGQINVNDDVSNLSLSYIIVIYFLLHLTDASTINTDYGGIDYVMENVGTNRFMENNCTAHAKYYRYEIIFNEAYKYIQLHR